jgi:hypothetical protein
MMAAQRRIPARPRSAALLGFAAWFLDKPDPQATQRQKICQSWGITDAEVLANCRQSPEQERAAIEPFKRSAAEREIAWFNQDLSALASGKTHAIESDYPSRSMEEVYQAAGGMLGFIIGPLDGATFPAKGRPAKLFGVIVSQEPDGHRSSGISRWKLRCCRGAAQPRIKPSMNCSICPRRSTSISNR